MGVVHIEGDEMSNTQESESGQKLGHNGLKERCEMNLKGQSINNFETPQYVRAHKDRVLLQEKINELEQKILIYENEDKYLEIEAKNIELEQLKKEALEMAGFYGDDSKWRGRILDESDYMHVDTSDREENYFNDGEHCGGKRARAFIAKHLTEGEGE
jgi:hypothetical protein